MIRAALVALALAATADAQTCTPYWAGMGLRGGGGRPVWYDDGSGTALYTVGSFHNLPGFPPATSTVARFRNREWEALPKGLPSGVQPNPSLQTLDLATFDLGEGPRLVCWGTYREHPPLPSPLLRVWDGEKWAVGTGILGDQAVFPIAVQPTGSGRVVYGRKALLGFPVYQYIMRWDTDHWTEIGDFDNLVTDYKVFDDGSGPSLHVIGTFGTVNGRWLPHMARWDGAAWQPVGGGVELASARAMCVYDDGTEPGLYVARMNRGGNLNIHELGRWDGTQWSNVGAGFSSTGIIEIYSMAVFDDGRGPALYVAGLFSDAGGVPARNLARWDGHAWSAVPPGMGWAVWGMTTHDDGSGESLYLAGDFETAGGGDCQIIVQYVGCKTGNCYADCNRDGALTLADFGCFQTKYALRDPYANCNLDLNPGSLTNGLSVADYMCFQTKFAAGCP
ncbi:MAG: hypothetical protein IT437_05060 [Phycisphaerales bacterium]|nr:hypothetical protein [Phycisphaerales bacterium]